MSNRPIGGGSAFGGGPVYRGGSSPSRTTPSRARSRGGRAPVGGDVPSERQLRAIRDAGFDERDFIPEQPREVQTGSGRRVSVSPGFARRVETLSDRGEFERVQTEQTAISARAGGASFASGPRAVTPQGESIALASTPEGSRFVTESGRDVTPTRNVRVAGILDPAPQPSGPVSGFARGIFQGVTDPLGNLPPQSRGVRRVDPNVGAAQRTGQLVGLPAGFLVSRGVGRVGGVAVRRGAARAAERFPVLQRIAPATPFVVGGVGAGAVALETRQIQQLPPGIPRLSRTVTSGVIGGGFSVGFVRGARAPFVRAVGSERTVTTRIPTRTGYREASLSYQRAERVTQGFFGERVEPGEIVSRTVTGGRAASGVGAQGFFVRAQSISQPRFPSDSGFSLRSDGTFVRARQSQVVSGSGFLDTGRGTVRLDTADQGLLFGGLSVDPLARFSVDGRRVSQTTLLSVPRQGDPSLATSVVSVRQGVFPGGLFGRSVTSPRVDVSPARGFSELGAFGFRRPVVSSRPGVLLDRTASLRPPRVVSSRRVSRPSSRRVVDDELFDVGSVLRLEGSRRISIRPPGVRGFAFASPMSASSVAQSRRSRAFSGLQSNLRGALGQTSLDRSLLVPRLSTGLGSAQVTRQTVIPRLTTSTVQTPSLRPPLAPPAFTPSLRPPLAPPGIPPAVPGFSLPNFGVSGSRDAPRRGRRRGEGFTPSLVAGFLNIRGSPSRTRDLTGLEVRPLNLNNIL